MAVAYFDCFNGAGGDMIVAALVDAGADSAVLTERLLSLGLTGYHLDIVRGTKQGFAATRFDVQLDAETAQPHRHLSDIVGILEAAPLQARTRDQAIRIFTRLAEAEAKVHGTTVEKVHFHEVGAVDAILDVVGAVIALELLGVDRVVCSAVPVGSGVVECEHGTMPVPAPAAAELLRGVPLASSDEPGELITPTAAAILTTLAASFGPVPPMTVSAVGYGAGTREGRTRPNVLRVMLGEGVAADSSEQDTVVVLETHLDDATPEVVSYCMDRLLDDGALDVFAVPIHMKKSRGGVLLTVLCEPGQAEALERVIFAETPTFGIRRHVATRSKLVRRWETVETPYGPIRMKLGERHGQVTASPEFEDCRAAAARCGAPLREVMDAAVSAWRHQRGGG